MKVGTANLITLFPSMIRKGMTGTHDGKKFTVIRHAQTGEIYCGVELINICRNKVWVNLEGAGEQLFAFPIAMSPKEWSELLDQMP